MKLINREENGIGLRVVSYSGLEVFYGVLRATHLFPNVMVGLATLVFGFVATRGQPDAISLLRVWLVVMSGHAAIGLLNDYLDRERDAIAQPDKPIPSGLVPARLVRNLIVGLLVLQTGLALTLPPGAIMLAGVATVSGLLYDLRLKDSYLSWVPYFLSFTSYLLFVWTALDRFNPLLLWLYPPALLLTIGINLANALPDIESDREKHDSHGLAHRLGSQRALGMCWLLFGLAPLFCLGMSLWLPVNRAWCWPFGFVALLVALSSIFLYRRLPLATGLEMVWKLNMVATFLTASGWLAALTL